MRPAVVSLPALLPLVLIMVIGAFGCGEEAKAPLSVLGPALNQVQYGSCATTTPQEGCDSYHPGSVATAFCEGEACFDMSYGQELRVVAADESGDFPRTWFAWHKGNMTPAGGFACGLRASGNKTRVEIPVDPPRCSADLQTNEYLYHEHFVSNPSTGCLAWLECREPPEP
jgi:hypothetical protein